jgi:hypothetical protein
MLNKAAQIIPGNGFQGGPTLLLQVTLGLLKLRVVWDFLLRNRAMAIANSFSSEKNR